VKTSGTPDLSDSDNKCKNSSSSLDSHNDSNLNNPETPSVRRSPRLKDVNVSVLEKSSVYFRPGGSDPRIQAIAAKTKSSLKSCDSELKEAASKRGMIFYSSTSF
jgi:hypothetical protein